MAVAVRGGDVEGERKLWETRVGSNVCSPLVHDGLVYFAHERSGTLYCLRASSGEIVYQQRVSEKTRPMFYASPMLADGRLYYVSRDEGVFVVAAGPEYKLLAHNVMASDRSIWNASPATADGKLFLRSGKAVYCIGARP
jgi:outer membrane protein assembly factor BamB